MGSGSRTPRAAGSSWRTEQVKRLSSTPSPASPAGRPGHLTVAALAFTVAVTIDEGAGAQAQRGIYVMNADGTGRRLLVVNAIDPAWSPNGSKIAYVAYRSRVADGGFVTVANADGTGARRLTASGEDEAQPAWSPGGRQIAFMRGGAIVVAPSAGGAERVAVRGALDPAWRCADDPAESATSSLFIGKRIASCGNWRHNSTDASPALSTLTLEDQRAQEGSDSAF